MLQPSTFEREPAEEVTVLSISPVEEDHASLKRIVDPSRRPRKASFNWAIHPVLTLERAVVAMKERRIPVIVSERDLPPGTWKHVLASTHSLPYSPLLIVTSRLADDYLWAEALNLGAYDVLAKPFDGEEVLRVLGLASMHWRHHSAGDSRKAPMKAAVAAR